MSIRSQRRTSPGRPASSGCERNGSGNLARSVSTMWFGAIAFVRSNQKLESRVSTRPFCGMGVGRTTSNAERRSLATITSSPSPASYTSRTLPLRKSLAPGIFAWVSVAAGAPARAGGGLRGGTPRARGPPGAVRGGAPRRGEGGGVLPDLGVDLRDLHHRAAAALRLESEPAHRLVRILVPVLREEHVERLGHDGAAGRGGICAPAPPGPPRPPPRGPPAAPRA